MVYQGRWIQKDNRIKKRLKSKLKPWIGGRNTHIREKNGILSHKIARNKHQTFSEFNVKTSNKKTWRNIIFFLFISLFDFGNFAIFPCIYEIHKSSSNYVVIPLKLYIKIQYKQHRPVILSPVVCFKTVFDYI